MPLTESIADNLPSSKQIFEKYLASEHFISRLLEAAVINDAYLARNCEGDYEIIWLNALPQSSPRLQISKQDKHPSAGIWRTRYRVKRCGKIFTYNAIFGARLKRPPYMRISNPGHTTANSIIAQKMRTGISKVALKLADMEECNDQRIFNSISNSPQKNVFWNGTFWKTLTLETWTTDVCGRLVNVKTGHGEPALMTAKNFSVEDVTKVLWQPSERKTSKNNDPHNLQNMLLETLSGKTEAPANYILNAANREVPFAQTIMAIRFRDGIGVKKDIKRAAFWAFRAAYNDYTPAMLIVGNIYEKGRWNVRDLRLAAAWYRRAIAAGNAQAKIMLANLKQ